MRRLRLDTKSTKIRKKIFVLFVSLWFSLYAADRRNIHLYNQMIAPTKPSSPSQGASAKSSGTSPIGASFEKPTMRPALITPHRLSPTIKPEARLGDAVELSSLYQATARLHRRARQPDAAAALPGQTNPDGDDDVFSFVVPANQTVMVSARTYDQLGYRAESGPWRDFYLTGAYELRHGAGDSAIRLATAVDMLRHMPTGRFFDSMAVRLNGPKAEGKRMTLNFVFTDTNESFVLTLVNCVLHHKRRSPDPAANTTVRLTKELLLRLATGQAGLREIIFSKDLDVDGSRLDLLSFFRLLDSPDGSFDVVTP